MDRHLQRGGGAPAGAQPHQAAPPAVQHPPAGRQVLSLHHDHHGGRVPAGGLHPATPPHAATCTSDRSPAPPRCGRRWTRWAGCSPVRTCRGRQPGSAAAARRACSSTSSGARRLSGRDWSRRRLPRSGGAGGGLPERPRARWSAAGARRCRRQPLAGFRDGAAVYRDRLEALRHVLERQQDRVEHPSVRADVTGLAMDDQGANVQVFITRDGKLADRRSLTLENVEGAGRATRCSSASWASTTDRHRWCRPS